MPEVIYDLNKKSGLLGISGVSSDMRDILAAAEQKNERSQLAIDIFVKDIVKYIGAYTAEMGGLDGLIFTAGIGENSPEIRELVTQRIAYLGIDLDQKLNQVRGKPVIISQPASKVEVMTIPTNEELMIARDVEELIKESSVKKAANF